MPKKEAEVSFLARLGKAHKRGGNLLIYVPKAVREIYGLNHGDWFEVTLKAVERRRSE